MFYFNQKTLQHDLTHAMVAELINHIYSFFYNKNISTGIITKILKY